MSKIAIIILSLFLISCSSHHRWLSKNKEIACDYCNQQNQIVIDTVFQTKDTVIFIYRDKFISLPSDTVIIERFIRYNNLDTITKEYGIITLSAWVNNKLLGATAYINDSTMLIKDTVFKKVITNREMVSTFERNIQIKTEVPWWYWFVFGISISLSFFIGLKIRKNG